MEAAKQERQVLERLAGAGHQADHLKQQQIKQAGQLEPAAPQLSAQRKRKEKARIAARARRSQEASIIMEMAVELHISQDKLRRIDKATIVKLAIDYIKAFEPLCRCGESQRADSSPQLERPLAASRTNQMIESRTDGRGCAIARARTDELRPGPVRANDDERRPARGECFETSKRARESEPSDEEASDNDNRRHEPAAGERARPRPQHRQQPAPLPLYSAPRLTTASIFAPKTEHNANSYFLVIEEKDNGKAQFVLKPDTEIQDEDDLTHLAPQAGDISISFETDPLDNIALDDLLVPSPPTQTYFAMQLGQC